VVTLIGALTAQVQWRISGQQRIDQGPRHPIGAGHLADRTNSFGEFAA